MKPTKMKPVPVFVKIGAEDKLHKIGELKTGKIVHIGASAVTVDYKRTQAELVRVLREFADRIERQEL